MKMVLRLFAFALLLTVVVSCGDATSPEEDITGTYNLETVNGRSPPTVVEDSPGFRVEVVSMSMTLNSDNTQTMREVYLVTTDGQQEEVVEESFGTWRRSGNTIDLIEPDGDVDLSGQLGHNTITFIIEGEGESQTLVFRKVT